MTRVTDVTSRALIPFTRGSEPPYVAEGVTVTRATPKDGVTWGYPVKRSNLHLVADTAAAWTPRGLILGARWVCGATSIGVWLFSPEGYMARYGGFHKVENPDDLVCLRCRSVRDGTDGPCVYRVWDKTGARLLYIGSTKNWPSRRAQHRVNTWWWQLAKSVDLTHYATIEEARAAEAEAIRAERPQMNVAHNRAVDVS